MAEKSEGLDGARIATASLGVAFALAVISFLFLNYGIALGFTVGAIICFIGAHKFPALLNAQFRLPFVIGQAPQRDQWQVFKLITYVSLGIAISLSITFGGAFYIRDLQERLANAKQQEWRLGDDERSKIVQYLSAHPGKFIYVNSASNCQKCEEYAEDIREAIGTAPNWKASGGSTIFGNSSVRGIKLQTNNVKNPDDLMREIAEAFNAAHLRYEWSDAGSNGYDAIYIGWPPR